MAACNVIKKNLGVSKCVKLPQLFSGMFTTPLGWSVPAATLELGDAAIQAFFQDAMIDPDLSKRIYLWPNFVGFEDAKEDAVYEETPLSDLKVRDGKYRWRFQVQQDLCLHRAMYTHNGGNQRVILLDVENQLFGMLNAVGDLQGFTLSLLNVEKLVISDGSVATKTPIYIVLKNSKQVDKQGVVMDGDFVDDLTKLTDVEITVVGTSTATQIKVTVKVDCDGTPVLGLVVGDFVLLKADGTTQTITSVVEANGVYTLAGVGLVTGTLTTVTPDLLSIQAYESDVAIITIP